MHPYTILRQAILPTQAQFLAMREQSFRPTPSFLGNFTFSCFGQPYGKGKTIPEPINQLAWELAKLSPEEQTFNALFIQRYLVGQSVKTHRDPRNNIGFTLILVLGQFTGATTNVAGTEFQLNHGDVLALPCTINSVQGPPHSVSAVTSGERFTVILNTII